MIEMIINRILRRQEDVTRLVGLFDEESLHAQVREKRDRQGGFEYWIDVQWTVPGSTRKISGLLRRVPKDMHFDVMREAQSFLKTLSR